MLQKCEIIKIPIGSAEFLSKSPLNTTVFGSKRRRIVDPRNTNCQNLVQFKIKKHLRFYQNTHLQI